METTKARLQKAEAAEEQIAVARAIVIVFGTIVFFLLKDPRVRTEFAAWLLIPVWIYGALILIFRPYKKYPVLLASWFSYTSDALLSTLWIFATGGFHSPFHVLYYTSIIAVAYRFGVRTTLTTCALYVLCYILLLYGMNQLEEDPAKVLVRCGYIIIIGYMASLITNETLSQTRQKLQLKKLMDEAVESRREVSKLNEQLLLQNALLGHSEQNAQLGSYYWRLLSNKITYSDNLYRLLGYEPGEFEPSLEKYASFIHPDDRKEFVTLSNTAQQQGKFMESMLHRVVTRNGSTRYLKVISKSTIQNSEPVVIGTVQDITDDIGLTETLRTKNRELERINNELSSFNYVTSHDLQEPLRKILTFADLLKERESNRLTETGHDYLSRIRNGAKRMKQLIEAFLNYSHLNVTSEPEEKVNLNLVLKEVKDLYQEELNECGGTLGWQQLPTIKGSHVQLRQVFTNLVGNALKYRDKSRELSVHITCEEVEGITNPNADRGSSYWKIAVKDNGIGFSNEYADKILEVFVRLHPKDVYEGTGVGLAICSKIISRHQGFMRAEGTPGEGSTFYLYLPFQEVEGPQFLTFGE